MNPLRILWSRRIVGHVDSRRGRRIRGWAVDRRDGNAALQIDVFLDGRLVRSEPADLERGDLALIGLPTRHGFDFLVDLDLDHGDTQLAIVARRRETPPNPAAKTNLRFSWRKDAARKDAPGPRRPIVMPGPGAIFLDISDLISFLRVHNYVTGIQRVVSGLIETIARHGDAPGYRNVHFATTARGDGEIRIFPIDGLLDLVGMAVRGGQPQAELTAGVEHLEEIARRHTPQRGDLYFITGAYWIVEDFSQRLARLREAGIVIGLYVYDLIPITHGQYVSEETRRDVVNRAIDFLLIVDFCFTISDFVRKEVEALVAIELDRRIEVTAALLPHQMNAPAKGRTIPDDTSASTAPFVLCVGTLEGRKNHVLLFRVWAALIRKYGRERVPDLVLVGKWGWNIDAFRSLCDASQNLGGKIRILPNVGDRELIGLYRSCLFSVYPSVVEGWGLPVGESLFHGKLCLASDRSSIPEVGGENCVYFDPHDVFDAYAKIERYIFDAAARGAGERQITETFRPRTWDGFTHDLLQAMRRSQAAAAARERPAIYPDLACDTVYALQSGFFDRSETIPWLAKQLKFIRAGSWGRIEDWGCWATGDKVQLRFGLKPNRTTPVRLYLELRLPLDIGSGSAIRLSLGDQPATIVALETVPGWHRFEFLPPADSAAIVTIQALFRPRIEDDREIYFGLSRLFCVQPVSAEGGDDLVPLRVLQSLSVGAAPEDMSGHGGFAGAASARMPEPLRPSVEDIKTGSDAAEDVSIVGCPQARL